jgi:two-component system CheB/CheR fusion protein
MANSDSKQRRQRARATAVRAPAPAKPGRSGNGAPARKPKPAPRAAVQPKGPRAAVQPKGPRAAAQAKAPPAEEAPPKTNAAFPIVGIGASAGGLEALETFLRHVPKSSGVAFVVIQHLDPTHKGMLVELLQRSTAMPVAQVMDQLRVEPDHVYVIPPNKDMSILHGTLHLLPQASPRGLNLPIDFFFRSLAEDQQERSIGVILSGMGSDGTLGLRAIKEKAGAAFVQSLTSAKFDGMPRSVIDSGLADVVADVEALPAKIIAYRKHAPHITRPEIQIEDKAQSALEKVFVLLRAQTGNDFTLYKKSTIYRRIERRMGLHQIDNIAQYVRFLRENPREIELLFKELLIGVTSFFRDPVTWEHLKRDVMPALLAAHAAGGLLRAWVPGCSTGEEAYSLAIVFKEAVEPFKPMRNLQLQIFATDLDRDAIETARVGMYPDSIAADVSPDRLRRFFVHDERGYRVGKEIREMVVFAPQNIIMDPPFTKLDILSCRNLLIYLSAELQRKLIPLFHYSLNPGGILFLGTAETVGSYSTLFVPLDGKTRLFRRLEQSAAAVPVDFPSTAPHAPTAPGASEGERLGPKSPPNIQSLADRVLVQRFSPVGILCNDKGEVLYISGRAGKYLEPAIGKANLNVFAMAREGLRYDLSSAFSRALREDRMVSVRGVRVGTNGGTQAVDLSVHKLAEPKELRGTMMIVVTDVAEPVAPVAKPSKMPRASESVRIATLETDLQRAYEEVQTTREEMQTSQEELKSTNEELQSTNEELQSTNEELTTSKEEMQSLNEELQTVNHELQSKVDELSRSNNDMKNLLNSTDIATLFLDNDLNVRRFTTPTTKIIKLIPGDAGRPITDIVSDLDYPDLSEDAHEVLRTLVFREKRVATRDGRSYFVRIMPYRTLENVIDGVVLTFTDTSVSQALEAAVVEQANVLRQMTESLPFLVSSCRPDGYCDYISPQWTEYTGMPVTDELGYGWIERIHPEDRERVREEWRQAIRAGTAFVTEFRLRSRSGEHGRFKTRRVPIRDSHGTIVKWFGASTEVGELKHGADSAKD